MTDDKSTEAVVQFQPQQWQEKGFDEYAVPHPDHDSVEFTVPIEDATDEDGDLLEDDSYASDALAEHENAPDWVNDWVSNAEGPFYISITETR